MHIEFGALINKILAGIPLEAIVSGFSEEQKTPADIGFVEGASVFECPKALGYMMSSHIGFSLANFLRGSFRGFEECCLPEQIARSLIEFGQREQPAACGLFRLEASELGHINASPQHSFLDKFFAMLFEHGAGLLFSAKSFVIAESDAQSGSGEAEEVSPASFHLESFSAVDNKDLRDFSELISQRGAPPSLEDRVIFFSLCHDAELDVGPYVANMRSSENVPWSLRRLARDTESISSALLPASLPPRISSVLCGESDKKSLLWPLICEILTFRNSYLAAERLKRGDVLAGSLLAILRAFYGIYNRREIRGMIGSREASPQFLAFAGLGKLASDIADLAKRALS